MSEQQQLQATIITIGDEILIGQTVDTNSAFLGEELSVIGIGVREIISVADQRDRIVSALGRAMQQSDIVLLTGGLGPTKDDITKATLAAYFDTELVLNEAIYAEIEAYMKKRGRPMMDSVKSLAMLPEDCTVIRNHVGTCAAMWFERAGKVVVSMPGVPHEVKDLMNRNILPKLKETFDTPSIIHHTIKCVGLGETIVAAKIESVESALPAHIKLAYLPSKGVLRLRLSGMGTDEEGLKGEVKDYADQIWDIMHPKYAFVNGDANKQLEEHIGELLLEREATMATAESCTGGAIAAKIVSIAGSSRYFEGGIVSYSNALKHTALSVDMDTIEEFGAVSEEVVTQMVFGAIGRTGADYAVAVSGVAGPGGGSKEKPVGTVWIATAHKSGRIFAKRYQLARTRAINIALTTNLALAQLRWQILELV